MARYSEAELAAMSPAEYRRYNRRVNTRLTVGGLLELAAMVVLVWRVLHVETIAPDGSLLLFIALFASGLTILIRTKV